MKKVLVLFFLIIFSSSVSASSIYYYDYWEHLHGTTDDAVTWGGFPISVFADGANSQADCLCWDWCDDGSDDDDYWGDWDNCYCESQQKLDDCMAFSFWVNNICTQGGGCWVTPDLLNEHEIYPGTNGDQWSCGIDVREYRDCDNSAGQQGIYNWLDQDGDPYWVVYGQKYDCDDTTVPDYEGDFGINWVNIDSNVDICTSTQECDENHDDIIVYDYFGYIDNPCRTISGYLCEFDQDCLSDDCVGTDHFMYRSHCVNSYSWDAQNQHNYPCCDWQCYGNWETAYNHPCGTGQQCDYLIDDEEFNYQYYPDVCRVADGYFCIDTADCLTGHYCVHAVCRDSDPYCGDGYCDPGEVCPGDSQGPEECDNIDNDCDGQIDEDLYRDCDLYHYGECAIGQEECEYGSWVGCPEPEDEYCDGLDNDCDEVIDNGDICPLINHTDLTPDEISPGGSVQFGYLIYNPNAYNMDIMFGAGLRDPLDTLHEDPANDQIINIAPGFHWYYRPFDTEGDYPLGEYDALLGIHTPDFSYMIDIWDVPNNLTISNNFCRDFDGDDDIDSQDVKQSVKIYYNLPGALGGFVVTKEALLDCMRNYT